MKNLAEIMYEVRDAGSTQKQIEVLKKYKHDSLFSLLRLSFSDKTEKLDKEPIYKIDDSPAGYSYTTLYKTYKNVPALFTEAASPFLKHKKDEKFLGLLESLHWTESAFLVNCLMKNIQEKYNLSLETLKAGFPGEFDKCQTITV